MGRPVRTLFRVDTGAGVLRAEHVLQTRVPGRRATRAQRHDPRAQPAATPEDEARVYNLPRRHPHEVRAPERRRRRGRHAPRDELLAGIH